MMVKSCSIIPVVFVAIFCSRVKDNSLKLGVEKIAITMFLSLGILVYNFGGTQSQTTNPNSLVGILLLVVSVLADGFLPDIQAVVKSEYNPKPTEMFEHTNKWIVIFSLIYAATTGQIAYLF